MNAVSLASKFAQFDEHWAPRIAGTLNGQDVKLVKIKGEFVWHHHKNEDEFFLVHRGEFVMEFRDRRVPLKQGDFIIVPRGIEHRPVAAEEAEIILFEPVGTPNTGSAQDEHPPAATVRI